MGPTDPDDASFRPPLPPEDRIWRHPSERVARRPVPAEPDRAPEPALRRHRLAALMVVSAMVGATLSVGVVALAGGFEERVVERRVAVAPVTSTVRRSNSAAAVTAQTAASVAAVRAHSGSKLRPVASAVVMRSDGHLLTTAHAVADASNVTVHLPDGRVEDAEVLAVDLESDLALLHVDVEDLVPAVVTDDPTIRAGDQVMTIGAASDQGWGPTTATAAVTAVGIRVRDGDGIVLHDLVVLHGAVGPGVVGAAVTSPTGVVVGLSLGGVDDDTEGDVVHAVPADVVSHVFDELLAHGHVRRPWLGIRGVDGNGLTGAGALVTDLADGGPAVLGGLLVGDLITAVNGETIPTMSALISVLRRRVPGDEVVVAVRRDGERLEVRCELGLRREPG